MKAFKILMLSIVLFQCQQPISELPTPEVEPQQVQAEELNYDDEMVLGKKLENPYAVKNMQKALDKVKTKWDKLPLERITANYVYIRLLPKDDAEYDKVNNDPEIDTFEYPLDFEIKKRGNTYKDKSVRDNKFTWIYCAVPLTKQFDKKIKQEVLEELYLPFGNGKEKETDFEKQNNGFLRELEEEALILTGNKKESMRGAKGVHTWNANGNIRVHDENLNYDWLYGTYSRRVSPYNNVPVVGCLARANRWFTTKTALTNHNGDFYINHSWGNGDPVNYSIKWDRDDFDIRTGSYFQAYFNGPDILGPWTLAITKNNSPDNFLYAHGHRAAFTYYYNNIYGINPPPGNLALGGKMHIGMKWDALFSSHYFNFNAIWQASQIKIGKDSGKPAIDVFGTTIHELAHASHWNIGYTNSTWVGSALGKKMGESWAQAVGWFITREIYLPHPTSPWVDFDSQQSKYIADFQAPNVNYEYTPLFIDLIDNFNQANGILSNPQQRPIDNVSGYSLGILENYLELEPKSWWNYHNIIQSQYYNPNVQYLFDIYD